MSNKSKEFPKEENEIVTLWRELKVEKAIYEFSCGGDSMNDTNLIIIGENGDTIENDVLENYIEDVIYDRVEFYVNSDGHYQGEFGEVEITCEDGDDDLCFVKNSQSEWSERVDSELLIDIDEATIKFINAKVLNINGGEGDDPTTNYKVDCILTDEEEELVEKLEELIRDECRDFSPDDYEGELNDWYTYTTNEEGEEIKIKDGKLVVQISNEVTIFRDE
jgi:hypothetical protein